MTICFLLTKGSFLFGQFFCLASDKLQGGYVAVIFLNKRETFCLCFLFTLQRVDSL